MKHETKAVRLFRMNQCVGVQQMFLSIVKTKTKEHVSDTCTDIQLLLNYLLYRNLRFS